MNNNDCLQSEANSRAYDEHKAENRRIAGALEILLADRSVTGNTEFTERLRAIDPRLIGKDFENKKLDKMRAAVEEILKIMRSMFSEYLRPAKPLSFRTAGNAVALPGDAPVAAQTAGGTEASLSDARAEAPGANPVEQELRALSRRFMSVDDVIEALNILGVTIPDDEIIRMRSLLPTELTPEMRAEIGKLRDATEDEAALLIMPLPEKVIYEGEEKPFTIELLQTIMSKAKADGSITKALYLSNYVTNETRTQTWGSTFRAWASKCLKDSKGKPYQGDGGQLALQKRLLGEGCEIHADMILAMALYYVKTGKEIMPLGTDGFMRLNDLGGDGYPLGVNADSDALNLADSHDAAFPSSGFGGSLRISS